MKTKLILFVSAITALTFVSCDKSENLSIAQTENSQLISEEQAVEQASTEIDGTTDEALAMKSISLKSANVDANNWIGSCAVVTIDTASATKSLTIDFGTSCVGNDGKTRSGKIIITSTSFSKLNVERTVSFQNFIVNGDTVTGTIKKTFQLVLDQYKRKAHIVEDIAIKRKDNAGTASRKADMYRIYDFNRPLLVRDDRITTWGTSQFTNVKGATLSKTVTELKPLIYRVACRQVVSGIQVITRPNKTLTIDFGDGICDGFATVSDGTNSWTIKL
ncbi:MAG: hypothetical protein ACOYOT_06830 [Bacteroidales bacterium]